MARRSSRIDKLDKIGADGVIDGAGVARLANDDAAARTRASRRSGDDGRLDANDGDAGASLGRRGWPVRAGGRRPRAAAAHRGSCRRRHVRRPHLRWTRASRAGLSYYTGAIMEVAVPDLAGSLGGGGRYDNLVGMFSGEQVPACGFSLGLERILVVMTERACSRPT